MEIHRGVTLLGVFAVVVDLDEDLIHRRGGQLTAPDARLDIAKQVAF